MNDAHSALRRASLTPQRRIPEALKTAGFIAFFILAYGIVGRMDYEDAVAMEAAAQAQQPQAVQLAIASEGTGCGQ